ncbi:CBO0543 family protein [Ureibacillus aquaedulcis]|uniref:CBO0543 family protein n=1 Tax=Ureibacillus aquaedulcis TaxID=3058421 RepID=A0ABT8GVU7_9BACL|nr:CBO0543 family protein [Ureibacillus sp. BA0131]MDN4495499.1 CBO0543 family protein [Ureibacillus sp. BA0131]
MLMERLILAAMWLFGFVGFFLFVPRKDRRKGLLAFMVFQSFIWLCDMPSFKYGLLSAPVREFPKATDLSITINYFFYPILFSIFYVRRRVKTALWSKFIYFAGWISGISLFDVVLERYTDLLEYGSLTGYGMWIYIAILFLVSQFCCNWFFKDKSLFQAERVEPHEN